MQKHLCKIVYIPLILLFLIATAQARQVVDMVGRTVELPDQIERVYVMAQANIVYTLDPDLLCGLAYPLRPEEKAMMDPRMQQLPVLGTLSGVGELANPEMLLAAKPDMIVLGIFSAGDSLAGTAGRAEATLDKLGIPYVYVTTSDLAEYPAAYEFMGRLLNRRERAQQLADYIRAVLADAEEVVAKVPPAQRPKVYYAQLMDGLSTQGINSFHTSLLKLAGDVNVHRQQAAFIDAKGYEKLSLEDVMGYNPDFILAFDQVFYRQVYTNPAWRHIKAVQNQKVLWIPRGPHNWFDRPPSFMRALGLQWLLLNLYPEHYQIDIVDEAVKFYRLFLFSDITHDEMRKIINPFE